MATIRKLSSGRFQAQIRRANLKTISKTFKLRKEAVKWSNSIEANDDKLEKLGSYNTQTLAGLIDKYQIYYDQLLEISDMKAELIRTSEVSEKLQAKLKKRNMSREDLLSVKVVKDTHVASRLAFWKKELGDTRLLDLNSDHIRAGIKILIDNKGFKPQTTNRYKANISRAISWAIEEIDPRTKQKTFIIKVNPCREVSGKGEGRGRKRTFSADELNKFLEASKKSEWDKFYLLVLMGSTAGARRGELLKLTWKDINFKTEKALCKDTKNGDDKELHLTPSVIAELRKFRGVGIDDQLVFTGQHGKQHDYRNDWAEALRLAEIPEYDDRYGERLVFHSLRHTFCSQLINNGIDMATVKDLAGHKTITTTQRYIHVDENVKKEAVLDVFGTLGDVK